MSIDMPTPSPYQRSVPDALGTTVMTYVRCVSPPDDSPAPDPAQRQAAERYLRAALRLQLAALSLQTLAPMPRERALAQARDLLSDADRALLAHEAPPYEHP